MAAVMKTHRAWGCRAACWQPHGSLLAMVLFPSPLNPVTPASTPVPGPSPKGAQNQIPNLPALRVPDLQI